MLTVVTAGCAANGNVAARGTGGRVQVVAAENFWGSIVRQLAGPAADVTSIISNPETDPHDYEPTPDDARKIASAQLVIENGIGYDPWAQQLLAVDGDSGRKVLNVGHLLGIADGGNPHQWYSQASGERFVVQVTRDLEELDPAHLSEYEQRKRTFRVHALSGYTALIARIRREFAGTAIGASESIVAPLAETLDLRLITPPKFLDAIAEGNEPTASDKATVDAEIRDHTINVFVFNSQNSTPDVQRLVDAARRERIPVATVTETLTPAGATFQSWQTRQLAALLAALRRSRR